jgi:hypothetical protein
MPNLSKPLLTSQAAADLVAKTTGAQFTRSRFYKDRMLGKAPEPAAKFGNRDLWTEEQIVEYANGLITWLEPDQAA